ncbi:synaptic vesicle glycoprotein 2B-like [Spodoptera litura]|uniref:Synaptic vesicle glycoprotein 2B-like n=1 Tax=Spodoptera litura TaxID=69820 RepID=A0A9J7IYI8_SPOLT|nr:synaptic vesicle glycoprotein 2B-like [Spodoptera litura]
MVCKILPKIQSPTRRPPSSDAQQDAMPEVADYETALDIAGYGRFSRSVLGACAVSFFASGVQNCVMSYVLPAARCELELTTYQAGLINMAFMSGGVASAFFWGIVGDVFGRRNVLSMTLLLDATITLAQSAVADYRLLLAARTINGFVIGGPATLVFSYLSDLVGPKKRQLYLSVVGMSFIVAWLILPAIAWLVIPFKMADYETLLPIYSWRLFLALSSIPGFISGGWVLALPESPRLLSDTNRSEKALKIMAYIYKTNHGTSAEFKIKKLIQDEVFVGKTLSSEESRTKVLFLSVIKDLKTFVSKSYAVKSSLILFMFFANMAAGFGLNMWIPELLLRIQGRECKLTASTAKPENARLFNATTHWKDLKYDSYGKEIPVPGLNDSSNFDDHFGQGIPCDSTIDSEVFTSGLIVGACCVLGNAACAILCARGGALGVRRAAIACTAVCALASACLAATACSCSSFNKIAVAAAAALNAASLNGNVLLIRLLLHALPARLSGLGVCWGAWWGRAGGVASNLAVGVLLDFSCPAPFIAVGALLALSIGAIMVIKLGEEREETSQKKEEELDHGQEKNTGLDRYISTYM